MELVLGDALAHGGRGAHAARDHLLQLVDVRGAAPLLVLDDVDAAVHLGLLDELAVGAHAVGGVGAGELVADEGGGVQASEGDELPAVAELGQAADVRLLVGARHGGLPVEAGAEVVGELLLGAGGVHAVGELLGLRKVGQFALHPDGVAEGPVGDGAGDGARAPAPEAVVALARARRVPVEEDVGAEEAAGHGARLAVGLAARLGEVLPLEGGLVGGAGGRDGREHRLVEAHQLGGREPLVLDLLQGVAGLAGRFGRRHEVVERLERRVGRA